MSARKYLIKRYLTELSVSEIDFDLYDFFKLKENDELEMLTSPNKEAMWAGESYPINIDTMLAMLNNLKEEAKCNFVEVMFHGDHVGYVVNGLIIEKPDANEVKNHKDKATKQKAIEAEMRKLEKQFKAKQKELEAIMLS